MKISKLTTFYILLAAIILLLSLPYIEGSQPTSGHRKLTPTNEDWPLQFEAGIGQTFDLKFWNIRGTFILNVNVMHSKVSNNFFLIQTINISEFQLTFNLNSSSAIQISFASEGFSEFDYSISISGMRTDLLIAPIISILFAIASIFFVKYIFWKKKKLRDSKFLEVVREELKGVNYLYLSPSLVFLYIGIKNNYLLYSAYGEGFDHSSNLVPFSVDLYRYNLTNNLIVNFGLPFIAFWLVVLSLNKVGAPTEIYQTYPIDPKMHYWARLTAYSTIIVPFYSLSMITMIFQSRFPGYDNLVPYYLPASLVFFFIIFFVVLIQLLIWDLFPKKGIVILFLPTVVFLAQISPFSTLFPFTLLCDCRYNSYNIPSKVPSLIEFIFIPLLKDATVIMASLFYRSTSYYRMN